MEKKIFYWCFDVGGGMAFFVYFPSNVRVFFHIDIFFFVANLHHVMRYFSFLQYVMRFLAGRFVGVQSYGESVGESLGAPESDRLLRIKTGDQWSPLQWILLFSAGAKRLPAISWRLAAFH